MSSGSLEEDPLGFREMGREMVEGSRMRKVGMESGLIKEGEKV